MIDIGVCDADRDRQLAVLVILRQSIRDRIIRLADHLGDLIDVVAGCVRICLLLGAGDLLFGHSCLDHAFHIQIACIAAAGDRDRVLTFGPGRLHCELIVMSKRRDLHADTLCTAVQAGTGRSAGRRAAALADRVIRAFLAGHIDVVRTIDEHGLLVAAACAGVPCFTDGRSVRIAGCIVTFLKADVIAVLGCVDVVTACLVAIVGAEVGTRVKIADVDRLLLRIAVCVVQDVRHTLRIDRNGCRDIAVLVGVGDLAELFTGGFAIRLRSQLITKLSSRLIGECAVLFARDPRHSAAFESGLFLADRAHAGQRKQIGAVGLLLCRERPSPAVLAGIGKVGRRNILFADVTPGADLRVAVVGSRLASDVLGFGLIEIVLAVRSDGLTDTDFIDIDAVTGRAVRIVAARGIVAVEVAETGHFALAGGFEVGVLGEDVGQSRIDHTFILLVIGNIGLIMRIFIIIRRERLAADHVLGCRRVELDRDRLRSDIVQITVAVNVEPERGNGVNEFFRAVRRGAEELLVGHFVFIDIRNNARVRLAVCNVQLGKRLFDVLVAVNAGTADFGLHKIGIACKDLLLVEKLPIEGLVTLRRNSTKILSRAVAVMFSRAARCGAERIVVLMIQARAAMHFEAAVRAKVLTFDCREVSIAPIMTVTGSLIGIARDLIIIDLVRLILESADRADRCSVAVL